jgi:hypothetical protein
MEISDVDRAEARHHVTPLPLGDQSSTPNTANGASSAMTSKPRPATSAILRGEPSAVAVIVSLVEVI